MSNELEAEKDFLNQFQNSDIAVEKTFSPGMVSEGDTLTFEIKVMNVGSTAAENIVMNDTFTDYFDILSTTTVSATCTVQGLAVSCDVGTLNPGELELIFVTARATKAGTTNNVATVTTSSVDNNDLNNIDTVEITIEPVSLRIDLVSVQHQTCINGILDVDEETTDGNRVIITVAVTNGRPEIAEAVTLHFKEAGLDRFLGDGSGVLTGIVPGSSTVEFEYTWNSTGWAWSDSEVAHLTARTIKVDGLRNGGLFGSVSKDVVVKPKPIILVHGLWSNAAAWGSYPGFANSQNANYAGRVSPATGMDTGVFPVEAMKNPTTMYEMFTKTTIGENAAALDAYIDQVRSETNSCHVDIVAHSMGGLISRHWIHNTMPPMEDDGERLLRHLVQLGTPNEGSPCADDIMAAYPKLVSGNSSTAAGFRFTNPPNNVIELTTTQVIYGFNPVVNNYKGVPIYLAYGNKFFFTCRAFDAGDGVVPVKSATAFVTANPIFTGIQEFNAEHTSMPGSESMYTGWVQPILSEPPGGGPLGYEPGLEDDSENGSWAASKVDGQQYLMTLAESVVRDQELVIDIPVGDVTSFGVSYLTAPGTDSQLFDPSGVEVASVAGGSDDAQIGLRAHTLETPESGTWQLKLNQSDSDEVGLLFSAWVIGSDVSLELQVDPASEPNHVLFKATFLQGTSPITGATASATAVAEEGSSIFPLFDDGSNGHEVAGDGVYSALFRPEQPGTFLFSVEAEGSGQFRTRTINQDITGISGVGIESADESIPTTFAFGNVYPNPTRNDARIPFQVAEPAQVDVRLYDMLGKERAVLASGMMQPGSYESSFSTSGLPSGQYLVRARIGNRLFTRKVSVVR